MKIDRQKVYDKYNGHCAYCGKEITIKDMEVDHAFAKRNGGTDDIENLMPACHSCNHYKRSCDIKSFREWSLNGLLKRLKKVYIFRVALDYGMVSINGWDRMFYFEKIQSTTIRDWGKRLSNAAKAFRDHMTTDKQDVSYMIGFNRGALWCKDNPPSGFLDINKVWHCSVDKPSCFDKDIIYMDKSGRVWMMDKDVFDVLHHCNWESFSKMEMLVKWAYVENLLPK